MGELSYHMPVLLNPLINAVFNCPDPINSPLRKLFERIKYKNFMLIVPPNEILLHYRDPEKGLTLKELCYEFEFVASHIILDTDNSSNNLQVKGKNSNETLDNRYKSLNNNQLLIKNNNIIPLDFNNSTQKKKYKIIDIKILPNFNEYLSGSEKYTIIYTDYPFSNSWLPKIEIESFYISKKESNNIKAAQITNHKSPLSQDLAQKTKSSFRHIINIHKEWNNIFDSYIIDFKNKQLNLTSLPIYFREIVDKAYQKMKFEEIFLSFHNDLYNLIFEYLESSFYNSIWDHIDRNMIDNQFLHTEMMDFLSIDQLELELYNQNFQKFNLVNVIKVERCVKDATDQFKKIIDSKSHSEKCQILIDALQKLTSYDDVHYEPLMVDADTLMNLFLLVICRSKVPFLRNHLYYLQNFSTDENNVKFGLLGYGISTFEATLCYLKDFQAGEKFNKQVLNCIRNKELISKISSEADHSTFQVKLYKDCFKFRNEMGESILALCIKHKKNETLFEILLNFEDMFPLEDILDDEDIEGTTLLMKALKVENEVGAKLIVDVLQSSCSEDELIKYFNRTDNNQRIAAHYITNQIDVLKRIGLFFNWKIKDDKGYTPLTTICRTYDQECYEQMIETAFFEAQKWYENRNQKLNFKDHNDSKENTLLHILKCDIQVLLKYDNININAHNLKYITPLMTYVKYNRVSNIQEIIRDERLILGKYQKHTFLDCYDFVKNTIIFEDLGVRSVRNSMFNLFSAYSLRVENSNWVLYFTFKDTNQDSYITKSVSLKILFNIIKKYNKLYPLHFIPHKEVLLRLTGIVKNNPNNGIQKLKNRAFLNLISNYFGTLIETDDFDTELFKNPESLTKWIKAGKRKHKKENYYKRMTLDDINMIKSFVQFNINELGKLNRTLAILKKLCTFLALKINDVNESYKLFRNFGALLQQKDISNQMKKIDGLIKPKYFQSIFLILLDQISFLEICTIHMSDNFNDLIKNDIPEWHSVHFILSNLKKQYKRDFSDFDSRNGLNENILSRYTKNKREAAEKRISEEIIENTTLFDKVTAHIWYAHENLAEEFNKFLTFKSRFFKDVILNMIIPSAIATLKDQVLNIENIHNKQFENN
ncbi:hypothetical protein Kpol_1037p25 [Vanderwaltozyma polyspora DSM 70294]|uniref:VPS9 domain-containing protein n=1 Tax=Vanderwaltozyma polyspora (strain ATCC 22028 / DSM 70294 / BCRC 21397 / CBS 2163 / NBRC 10782 / NRRL Y-8283 / UCD 57-17) TaxID=436907 RepID=A7TJW7_VANPO|nr:uncharacterized protein Kpol_1037p25 [Vanderwaltozyma polyspora DSM 70294]EDO17429.1 hypothetical protein Kpol_1037p25 [Vanderwaltozyma polyspora DSM 70294]